jgi:putative DNA modification/repair radical SAM protein
MDTDVKLSILADAAKYDASCASSGSRRANDGKGLGNANGTGICHSYTPDGRCVSLLKLLLTNHCIYDCQYCVNRASNDIRRARFTVDEVVNLTVSFYKRNYIEGLFLSSGVIRDPDYTMDQLAEVARKLREEHRFFGYIHLKAVVGASEEAVARAGKHADRLSANLEMPQQEDLDRLAPGKSIRQTELTMTGIKSGIDQAKVKPKATSLRPAPRKPTRFAPAGQSTQMVIGASPASDGKILGAADRLYRRHRLRRVYYSAYTPIPDAPRMMPEKSPPMMREHRLYQADWLLRFYGFKLDEILAPDTNLDLDVDPKLAWALRHRELFPIDVNLDAREMLLRVPGLGVRNVDRLLRLRRQRSVRDRDLQKLRVPKRARSFLVTADGHQPTKLLDKPDLKTRIVTGNQQLNLFAAATSALSGQV